MKKCNPKSLTFAQIYDSMYTNKDIENIRHLGSGVEGRSYYFNVNKNTHIFETLIKKGQYVIKIYKILLKSRDIRYLKKLSNYGLIPKIYYIDSNIIIMKYINGKTYDVLRKHLSLKEHEYILDQINNLIKVWENLGFAHDDISDGNILITENLKVYFIDPYIPSL